MGPAEYRQVTVGGAEWSGPSSRVSAPPTMITFRSGYAGGNRIASANDTGTGPVAAAAATIPEIGCQWPGKYCLMTVPPALPADAGVMGYTQGIAVDHRSDGG